MKQLASSIGTTLSNLYEIIKDGLITVLDYELNERIEFNANTAGIKELKNLLKVTLQKENHLKSLLN